MTRYEALLKVCDMACKRAEYTGEINSPIFFDVLAAALHDDCPQQALQAERHADAMRRMNVDLTQLLFSLSPPPTDTPPGRDGDGSK